MSEIVLQMQEAHHFIGFRSKVEIIQRAVIEEFPGVSMLDMLSPRRAATIVRPRHIAMYLARNLTKKSLPALGKQFGNRDHTTVLHGIKKITRLLATDQALAGLIAKLKSRLEGQL